MQEESLRQLALGTVAILVVMFLVGARGSSANQASGSMTEVQIILSDFKIESPQNTFSIDRPYRFVIKNGLIAQQDVWNDLAESGVLEEMPENDRSS